MNLYEDESVNLYQYVANRIRELRTHYGGEGLSQEALGKALSVATNTVSRWETGTYKPDLGDLDKLARFFGVSILNFLPPEQSQVREPLNALLRAAKELPDEDILELQRYAEFRSARHVIESQANAPRSRPGRRRKESP
jgi:transcriptional regulator with XRE-family HTH domain